MEIESTKSIILTPTPAPKLVNDLKDASQSNMILSSTPTLTAVSVTNSSITFNSAFPILGNYNNHLAYWDPHEGQWYDVPGQGHYATNGNHTITRLQPYTTYIIFMSWWDYATNSWKDIPWLYVTTSPLIAPSLKEVSITNSTITFNSVFPISGNANNHLAYWDPHAGQWYDVPGQAYYATNGNHTITGLQPNTTYIVFMSWWDYATNSWRDLPWLYVTTSLTCRC